MASRSLLFFTSIAALIYMAMAAPTCVSQKMRRSETVAVTPHYNVGTLPANIFPDLSSFSVKKTDYLGDGLTQLEEQNKKGKKKAKKAKKAAEKAAKEAEQQQ